MTMVNSGLKGLSSDIRQPNCRCISMFQKHKKLTVYRICIANDFLMLGVISRDKHKKLKKTGADKATYTFGYILCLLEKHPHNLSIYFNIQIKA